MNLPFFPTLIVYGIASLFGHKKKNSLKAIKPGFSIEVAKKMRRCKKCGRVILGGKKVLIHTYRDGRWWHSKGYCKLCGVYIARSLGGTFNDIEKSINKKEQDAKNKLENTWQYKLNKPITFVGTGSRSRVSKRRR